MVDQDLSKIIPLQEVGRAVRTTIREVRAVKVLLTKTPVRTVDQAAATVVAEHMPADKPLKMLPHPRLKEADIQQDKTPMHKVRVVLMRQVRHRKVVLIKQVKAPPIQTMETQILVVIKIQVL